MKLATIVLFLLLTWAVLPTSASAQQPPQAPGACSQFYATGVGVLPLLFVSPLTIRYVCIMTETGQVAVFRNTTVQVNNCYAVTATTRYIHAYQTNAAPHCRQSLRFWIVVWPYYILAR